MAESSQNNGWVESYLEALVRPPFPLCPLATCWTARSAPWRPCAFGYAICIASSTSRLSDPWGQTNLASNCGPLPGDDGSAYWGPPRRT